jgi:hypothetical protein
MLGALPMANVLAISLLIGLKRPGKRLFLLGFLPFGTMALALYVAMACSFPRQMVTHSVGPLSDYLGSFIKPDLLFIPAQTIAGAGLLVLPQVLFGLIGGSLSRHYMVTIRISRRPERTSTG